MELEAVSTPSWFIEVRQTKTKGRGVFALSDIEKDSIIEVCPVITMPRNQIFGHQPPILLENYAFNWGQDGAAIALGFGSLYNHSLKNPNADFEYDIQGNRIIFYALKDIKLDEEIVIDYGTDNLDFKEE